MLRKPITFVNFDGVQVTKDYFFNLTKAELALAEVESDGTWSQSLEKIRNSDKGSVVVPEFKKIIKWTYGERGSDDSFDKSDAAWARFENTEAWSALIMELLTDPDAASAFINGVLPPDIAAKNREQQATNGFRPGADTSRPTPSQAQIPQAPVQQAPQQEVYIPPQQSVPPQTYDGVTINQPSHQIPETNVIHTSEPRDPQQMGQ